MKGGIPTHCLVFFGRAFYLYDLASEASLQTLAEEAVLKNAHPRKARETGGANFFPFRGSSLRLRAAVDP